MIQKPMEALANQESLKECLGCGSTEIYQRYSVGICQCRKCGLLFRNPRPTQAAILASYNTGETYDSWIPNLENFKSMWEIRAKFVRKHAEGKTLLDIGSGDGLFLVYASEVGYEVSATEASEAGASRIRGRGFSVLVGQLEDLSLKGSYDVITIWHVLEHVPFPRKTLEILFRLLKPGGHLIVAVPNELNAVLKARIFKTEPFKPLLLGSEIHLTHFTPLTLKALVKDVGFDVRYFGVDYANPFRWKLRDFRSMFYEIFARIFGVHPANCMQLVARKR